MVPVKEGADVLLKCDSWRICYSGYEDEKHYVFYIDERGWRRGCYSDNTDGCVNFGDGSRLIEYENYDFAVYIKNISIINNPSGLYWCRMQDSGTGRWSYLRKFNVVIE